MYSIYYYGSRTIKRYQVQNNYPTASNLFQINNFDNNIIIHNKILYTVKYKIIDE